MSFANGYHVGMFYKRIVYIHESVEPVLSPVPLVKAFALPCSSKRATPIQRQISCNIDNDKKLCVNANIYSI